MSDVEELGREQGTALINAAEHLVGRRAPQVEADSLTRTTAPRTPPPTTPRRCVAAPTPPPPTATGRAARPTRYSAAAIRPRSSTSPAGAPAAPVDTSAS